MCVSPTHRCLFIGMLMPAMRAMCSKPRRERRERKSAAFYGKWSICSRSSISCSSLPLFVAGIGADHVHHPAAAHDLAVLADLLDGRTNLHVFKPPQPPDPLLP